MHTSDDTVVAPSRVLVVGDLEAARRTCAALSAHVGTVLHLGHPTDQELRQAMTGGVDAVAIVVRGDVVALRYALLAEYLQPGVRLTVTLFDRTVAAQLVRTMPNCRVTSPADVAIPSIVGSCLGGLVLTTRKADGQYELLTKDPSGVLRARPLLVRKSRFRGVANRIAGQLRPPDVASRIMLTGIGGLLAVLIADWLITVFALHESWSRGLYSATLVAATVAADHNHPVPPWYQLISVSFVLTTIGFTALGTAGLVNRLSSLRTIGLVGLRTLPVRDHIVVVGLGQIGLRVCTELKNVGVPTVAVERNPDAALLRMAVAAKIPVLIAHAEDRTVLERLSLSSARAIAIMGSEDLENIEVAIAALAVTPRVPIVMRAGDDDVVSETRALFSIGTVVDVSAQTALALTASVLGRDVGIVYSSPEQHIETISDIAMPRVCGPNARCVCHVAASSSR